MTVSDPDANSYLLMSPARIERTITRIAYQIYEDTRGSDQLFILGIHKRGYQLAVMLAEKLSGIYGMPITARPLGVKEKIGTAIPADPELTETSRGKRVIVFDDVLYSGRTMFEAIRQLTMDERPEEIRLAALIDRGHRRYPVDIRYLGLYCPTKLKEHVHCRLSEDGKAEGVWLISSVSSLT